MSTRHEYAPALLRAYAQALSASGWGTLAAQVQALAVTVEHRPPARPSSTPYTRRGT
ncbi:hypothetical protein MSS93_09960 [Deinococcus radiodurans]|nr:hypothetical protein MSS93_09960 [Deinococcus radiodurans]